MDININDGDDRVGSARDNSTGGTLGKLNLGDGKSESLSSLFGTLIPVLVYAIICVLLFWIFRRRVQRVYSPRSILRSLFPHERSRLLPQGWVDWVKPFFNEGDIFILNHSSLDAFLFLRYLKVLSLISFVGCCLTWPVLFPIHLTGGAGLHDLDSITIGNVQQPAFFFAHVAVAWVFFSFILFTIWRECIYYINLRHAYLLSPYYAKRLSSRTVLFNCVPDEYLDAARLRKVYGDTVKNVWVPQDTSELEQLVDERNETAVRLEKAEIQLIKHADNLRKRGLRSAPEQTVQPVPQEERPTSFQSGSSAGSLGSPTTIGKTTVNDSEKAIPTLPDVNGSVAAQWVPANERPFHRPLANFYRRVDTIKWTRSRIRLLTPKITKLRRSLHGGDGRALSSVFIEFSSQADAQQAYQTLAHDKPLFMSPRFIGVRPDEIVWNSLQVTWFSRIVRRFAMMALIAVAIVFWSIPSALVGSLTNITFLSESIIFLSWIKYLPSAFTGLLTGLLPALALSWLMAIVPWMLRGVARVACVPSLSHIELYVQTPYFAFQVVQVFLVTTLTSAASAALTSILAEPLSAKDLLAENLPKASNFYISYILVQCLAAGASAIFRLVDLIRHGIMARWIQNPRARWGIWRKVRPRHWGGMFPVFTNMGVIAISYSCIAPVILGFATVGLYVIYVAHKYNLLFVHDCSIDTRGIVYPKALMHLLVGLYLAEICLVGLFVLRSAFYPMLLMVVFLIFTAIFHMCLSDALAPLLYNLPRILALETEEAGGVDGRRAPDPPRDWFAPNMSPMPYMGEDIDEGEEFDVQHETTGSRGFEGGPSFIASLQKVTTNFFSTKIRAFLSQMGLDPFIGWLSHITNPAPSPNPNFILRFFHPSTFDSYFALRDLMPTDFPDPSTTYPPDYYWRTYFPPEMWMPPPRLWIPRDEAGVSAQEVEHCRRAKVEASDEGAWLDEKGRVVCELEKAPYWDERVLF